MGDEGPATRPTDKTDITPYTNHIYTAKSKPTRRRRGLTVGDDGALRYSPPTRRETEEEGVKEYLLDLAAKEVERQIEEAALAAFPNSRAREGGVAHFYFRDSSDSDNSPQRTPEDQEFRQPRVRRKSSNLSLNWWHKHMQEHAEHAAYEREADEMAVDDVDNEEKESDDGGLMMPSDADLDMMELTLPPDPMWTTTKPLTSDNRRDSMADLQQAMNESSRHALGQVGERQADLLASMHEPLAAAEGYPKGPHSPLSHTSPTAGHNSPFGRPFGAFRMAPENPLLAKMRQAASPPMLGKELIFRTCPSPKLTKLETDHPFGQHRLEEQNRDASEQGGLWRGYCCRSESTGGCIVPPILHNPAMMVTPHPPATPREPPLAYDSDSQSLTEEPASVCSSSSSEGGIEHGGGLWCPDHHRPKNTQPKGLHMLHGLDERLQLEKARAERAEKISQEFDDKFITQVYNYLSLGYPAAARSFDDELSKISQVTIEDLGRYDERQMAKGHLLEMKLEDSPENDRCPRWLALKIYINEWARQHPNLDNLDPLAWGVRERRGSWAI